MIEPKATFSQEAEASILSTGLTQPEDCMDVILEKLKVEDFFVPAHKEIYRAYASLHAKRSAIDITTVMDYFTRENKLKEIGGVGKMVELQTGHSSAMGLPSHIAIVKRHSLLRRITTAGRHLLTLGTEDAPETAEDIICEAEKAFGWATSGMSLETLKSMKQVADTCRNYLEDRMRNPGRIVGITSGFPGVDRATGGWAKKEMIVIGGRPGDGKSAFAWALAVNAARAGNEVGVISLENTDEVTGLRHISNVSDVSIRRMRAGEMTGEDSAALNRGLDDLESLPIWFEDCAALNIIQLKSKCRYLVAKKKCKIIFIDYIQLLDGSEKKHQNRATEITEISSAIRSLAKELDIPIFALAQLKRPENPKAAPRKEDLKESGSIEQDAHAVILLWRNPDEQAPQFSDRGIYQTQAIIDKQRNGPLATLLFTFQGNHCRFVEKTGLSRSPTDLMDGKG